MVILIKIIGIYLMAIGCVIILRPKAHKKIFDFFRHGKRIYLAGALRILFGALLLSVAPQSRLEAFLTILGVLSLVGGILIFLLKQAKLYAMMDWFEKRPAGFTRLWGIVAVVIGALFVYSV